MLRLDYVSCCLTVLATILLGRKNWAGLVLASLNSAIVCVIGVRTSQYGFIPANLFCIGVYSFSLRSWLKAPGKLKTEDSVPALLAPPVATDEVSNAPCGRRAQRFSHAVSLLRATPGLRRSSSAGN